MRPDLPSLDAGRGSVQKCPVAVTVFIKCTAPTRPEVLTWYPVADNSRRHIIQGGRYMRGHGLPGGGSLMNAQTITPEYVNTGWQPYEIFRNTFTAVKTLLTSFYKIKSIMHPPRGTPAALRMVWECQMRVDGARPLIAPVLIIHVPV